MTLADACDLVDRLAPDLDGAQRHAAVVCVLAGWRPETAEDIESWLARTGVRALDA
jgi:hypothetical protein